MTTMKPLTSPPLMARSAPAGGPSPIHILDATPACNIGPGELRRRRRSAIAALVALGGALLAIVAGWLPSWALPWLAPIVGAVVVSVLQVRLRLCVAFAFSGVAGMGERPGASPVSAALRAAHRRRAALMVLAGALAMVAWVLASGWLVLALG